MVRTIEEMKPQLQEMYDWFFENGGKLRSLPEEEQDAKAYEIGRCDGAIEALGAVMLMIGMPLFEMMMEHIAKEREGGGLA